MGGSGQPSVSMHGHVHTTKEEKQIDTERKSEEQGTKKGLFVDTTRGRNPKPTYM